MKHKKFFLLSLLSLLILPSCFLNPGTSISNETKTMDVYSLIDKEVTINQQATYHIFEDNELLPYFSFSEYASLIEQHYGTGYYANVTETFYSSEYDFYNPNGQAMFVVYINTNKKSVLFNGSPYSGFKTEKDYSKTTLSLRATTYYDIAKEPETIKELSYVDMGFTVYRMNQKNYFPLSLLEAIFAPNTGIFHFYNYQRLLQYTEYEQLTDTTYQVGEKSVTAFLEMNQYISDHLKIMPLYLRIDRRASFLFTMENLYGLKYTRNIPSMKEYLERQDFYSDFLSEDNEKRTEAYYKTFVLLDDGHTSTRNHQDLPWLEGDFNRYGPKLTRMFEVRQMLSTERAKELAPGDVYYSSDEKLAFFTFDSFSFAEYAYQEDGRTLREDLSDYHSENYDTIFYFVKQLNQIKNKGGVTDVVIDISTNGGGVIGIMGKLITLLAKENTSDIYIKTDRTGMVQKMTTTVDSNGDGRHNSNDVFGSDFKFHILTSEFSFSCGNAFPFFLKKQNIASIIGVKSGGGECAVDEAYLPSGEHYYHSGELHIGWYDGNGFVGDEEGVPVDIPIEYEDFFDLDKIQTLIKGA